jgi:hypothetical protein
MRRLIPSDDHDPKAEDLPLFQMVHAHDPETSKVAAVTAQDEIASRHRRLILAALEHFGLRGGTAKEIARFLGPDFSSVQITRRIVELRKGNLVVTLDKLEGVEGHRDEAGHSTWREERENCCVHVLAQHHVAAVAIYRAEATSRAQRKAAMEIIA